MSTRKRLDPRPAPGGASAPPAAGSPVKHAAIVEAAKRVFLREGVSRASVDTIAAEAGVSKQTIYNHFGDKERLFFAVIEGVQGAASAEQERALDELFATDAEPAVALGQLGRRLLAWVFREDLSAFRRLVVSEVARYPQLRLAWAQGGPLRFMIRLVGYLARETERGRLDVAKPERAARQFIALLSAEAQDVSVYGTLPLAPSQIDAIVDENLEMFLRAYGPRPKPPVRPPAARRGKKKRAGA
ncbi:TetR/AcrR family transcriptional regulator [Sorangium sp. So ce385]|uniref:TetR/AcrR family transcriptional regulator n=1 Tax=Sorangium sp. So ce385 TaxID=3133308 RepID=UPI003F5CB2EF